MTQLTIKDVCKRLDNDPRYPVLTTNTMPAAIGRYRAAVAALYALRQQGLMPRSHCDECRLAIAYYRSLLVKGTKTQTQEALEVVLALRRAGHVAHEPEECREALQELRRATHSVVLGMRLYAAKMALSRQRQSYDDYPDMFHEALLGVEHALARYQPDRGHDQPGHNFVSLTHDEIGDEVWTIEPPSVGSDKWAASFPGYAYHGVLFSVFRARAEKYYWRAFRVPANRGRLYQFIRRRHSGLTKQGREGEWRGLVGLEHKASVMLITDMDVACALTKCDEPLDIDNVQQDQTHRTPGSLRKLGEFIEDRRQTLKGENDRAAKDLFELCEATLSLVLQLGTHVWTPRVKTIMLARLRLGESGPDKTLSSLGGELGISRERVRQMERHAAYQLSASCDLEDLLLVRLTYEGLYDNYCGGRPRLVPEMTSEERESHQAKLRYPFGGMNLEEVEIHIQKIYHGLLNHLYALLNSQSRHTA